MSAGDGDDAVRFLDVLTVASAIARAHAAEAVAATHLLDAIAVLAGETEMEEAAGPVSPLGRGRAGLGVEQAVRDLSQRWFERLGGAPEAVLNPEDLDALRTEIRALIRS